ncbi:MAG: alpha/beta hydrolase [Hyphomicrobiales bacterium]
MRPSATLVPLETRAAGTSKVTMLVATTRSPSADPGVLFDGGRSRDIALTSLAVSIPPDRNRKIGEVQWPRSVPPDPEKSFATLDVTPLHGIGSERRWLDRNLPKARRVLIFVHGFNNQFEDAVYRYAQIVHDSGVVAAPVLFTWPSRGSVFAYGYDRESTNFSRDAFEKTVWQISQDPDVEDVTILGHSMGAWLVMEGMRQMAIRHGKLPANIKNIILASPDIDVDVFATQWLAIRDSQARMTLFVSRNDKALRFSRRIAGRVDRVGQVDTRSATYYRQLERSGIAVFDLSDLRGGDSLNHSKFAQSPEVVRLIGKRLVAGQTITDSDASLGEQLGIAAIGVGQAMGEPRGAE